MNKQMNTCILLKRLNVLWQTVHENCVVPTRISAGEGIQYWLGTWLPLPGATATWFSPFVELTPGGAIDSAIVRSEGSEGKEKEEAETEADALEEVKQGEV